jgi:hypothetical protein
VVSKLLRIEGIDVYDSDTHAKRLLSNDIEIRNNVIALIGKDAYTGAEPNKKIIAQKIFNEAATNEDAILIGTRMEKACSPDLNTGMFTAMREGGDVMGIFCGHDHDNDYATMYHGILLAYGRFTGGNTEYNHLRNGGRVIILKEGKRTFDTYIHVRGGNILNRATYPTSFVKDDWQKRPDQE